MKLTIFILLFFTISGFSQEIKYDLFLRDSCKNTIEKSSFYHLEKDGIKYEISDFDGTILLPTKGKYKLIAPELEEDYNIIIDKIINSDTLVLPKINEYLLNYNVSHKIVTIDGLGKIEPTKTHNYQFSICEKKCNGIETDYYSNGIIRLKAEFKSGLVIGELKRYYQNGKIKEISIYDKDGFLTKTTLFEENGEIKKE